MKTRFAAGLRLWSWLVLASMAVQIAGCGTLLYPERRGQKAGRIDAGVAILDAVGLFFCIIPGVIAYAVDFATGAIYLPAGSAGTPASGERIMVIQANPADLRDEIYLQNLLRSSAPQLRNAEFDTVQYTAVNRGTDVARRIQAAAENKYREELL